MDFLLLASSRFRGARLINAERFFVQKVSRGGESPGAATHADIAKLAVTTLALQITGVAELEKHRGVLPNLRQTLLMEIASQNRQIAARVNFTLIG
ncbi:MAG: hypothetical protein WB579_02410, partial [Bryobacteraceae bacterium]